MSKNLQRKDCPKILVANGVNLDLLGRRNSNVYGTFTLSDLKEYLLGAQLAISKIAGFKSCNLIFFQSNSEHEFLETLSEPWDGMILNPGAWTHTSLALADRLEALDVPFVEVHISNILSRECERQHSKSAKYSRGIVMGMGKDSYLSALLGLLHQIS